MTENNDYKPLEVNEKQLQKFVDLYDTGEIAVEQLQVIWEMHMQTLKKNNPEKYKRIMSKIQSQNMIESIAFSLIRKKVPNPK